MRGRTFRDSIVIADEMQNSSINQMKMLLTRIGHNSKIIITGDLMQCDIDTLNNDNGLKHFTEQLFNKYSDYYLMLLDGFGHVNLDESCIERHEMINKIISRFKNVKIIDKIIKNRKKNWKRFMKKTIPLSE
jgi:phosphate starvation-inducible PhoH-like protein